MIRTSSSCFTQVRLGGVTMDLVRGGHAAHGRAPHLLAARVCRVPHHRLSRVER
jgi:hypothetical protein